MNILFFNYEYPPLGGGGGVFNRQLAECLAGRGHGITVITSRFGGQPLSEEVNGVRVERVSIPFRSDKNAASLFSMLAFFPASILRGRRLLQQDHFDLVHSMFAVPSAVSGLLAAKMFHKPHLLSVLGGDIYDPSKKLSPHNTPLLHKTVGWTLNASDGVVSLSTDIRERARTHYPVNKDISLIPLGIPRPQFTPVARERFGFHRHDILLVTVGRLVARKAVHQLIDVVATLGNPAVKLVVVGDGPQRADLEGKAATLGITGQIRFMGNVGDNEKFAILDNCDIFVSSSMHEGFGIVFLEAMALGLPIICYDNGGQMDYLSHGITGAVVPCGDTNRLTDELGNLTKNTAARAKIAAHNRQYSENFFISACADSYLDEYKKLLETKKTR